MNRPSAFNRKRAKTGTSPFARQKFILGSFNASVLYAKSKSTYVDLAYFNFLTSNAYAGVDPSGGTFGGGASIALYSPELTFHIGSWDLIVGGDLVGAGYEAGFHNGRFEYASVPLIGYHFSLGPAE